MASDDDDTPLALRISSVVTLSYATLHTAYDERGRTLALSQLVDVLLVRRSVGSTLAELDQLLLLTGTTLLGIAFFPLLEALRMDLLGYAMVQLSLHGCYAAYVSAVTGAKALGVRGRTGIKKVSLALGAIGQLALVATYSAMVHEKQGGIVALIAWALHQYTLTLDRRGEAQVRRPVAHAAQVAAWLALAWQATLAKCQDPRLKPL